MTCIAAIVEEGRVHVAGDSCAAGDGSGLFWVRKDPKVFRLGDCVIGFTTSFRMGQLLRYRVPAPQLADRIDPHRYLAGEWIDEVRATFEKYGYKDGGVFLVGHRDRLFQVDTDFQVAEYARPYIACGSGTPVAEGALFAIHKEPLMPRAKLFLALSAAAEHCLDVRPPFTYESTEP